MYYVEIMFAQKRLIWFTSIFLALAAVFVYFVTFPPASVHVHNAGQEIDFNAVLIGSSFAALIMASLLAGTLNRDQPHLAYLWTRPASRLSIALSCMLVDIATIALAYGVVVAICLAVLAIPPQNHLILDSHTAWTVARSIAVPLMAYALIELGTSWNPQRQSAAAGIFWASAWMCLILSEILPFPFAQILRVVNLLNPIAYVTDIHGNGVHVSAASQQPDTIVLTFPVETMLAYLIFVAGCAVAIYNWKRMEA